MHNAAVASQRRHTAEDYENNNIEEKTTKEETVREERLAGSGA